MTTLAEIDAGLQHARTVPPEQRTSAWHALVDSMLAERTRLLHSDTIDTASIEQQQRSTRLLSPRETR